MLYERERERERESSVVCFAKHATPEVLRELQVSCCVSTGLVICCDRQTDRQTERESARAREREREKERKRERERDWLTGRLSV